MSCIENHLHVSHYSINTQYTNSDQIETQDMYKFKTNSSTKETQKHDKLILEAPQCLYRNQ